jgi:hypothetical protein
MKIFPLTIYVLLKQTFHSNYPVRLKKSLWESRTTATLDGQYLEA